MTEPLLIIFGGFPGVGKTTVSHALAKSVGAVYLRVDTIETAITNSSLDVTQAENAGYLAAFELAKENLMLGHIVIADSVNSIEITRQAWKECAVSTCKKFLEVEIVCTDQKEHRRRLEARNADVEEPTPLVTWEQVQKREHHEWNSAHLRLDTSKLSVEDCVEQISHLACREYA